MHAPQNPNKMTMKRRFKYEIIWYLLLISSSESALIIILLIEYFCKSIFQFLGGLIEINWYNFNAFFCEGTLFNYDN